MEGTKFVRPKSYSDKRCGCRKIPKVYLQLRDFLCDRLLSDDWRYEVDNYVSRSHKLLYNIEEQALDFVSLMEGELECESKS